MREGLRLVDAREVEERVRLKALRAAVRIGISNIEAGAFRAFEARQDLAKHLADLTEDALGCDLGMRRRK